MKKWSLQGFDALSKGTLGESGQNLYVSANGTLQRIWQFDVNSDGYVDLLIANSHDFNEHPNLYIISDPTGTPVRQEVLTQGAQTGDVADLNGDGYDDLVFGSMHDGQHSDLPSYVFFGGKDGITENRKIDLAAPACACCGIGDFNGDGKKEVCYLVSSAPDASSPDKLFGTRLRIYSQGPLGFHMDGFQDYPADLNYFTVADIDGDGCDDLYCRAKDGRWLVLWGSPDGFSMENSTEIGEATDDHARFNLLPGGGGNVRYDEIARSKVLTLRGKKYLFYAAKDCIRLIHFDGRKPSGDEIVLQVPNVISAGSGSVQGQDDLVLLQINSVEDQSILVYYGASGYEAPAMRLETVTPRDVLLCDLSGNGHDDVVVIQGRTIKAFTSESLLFCTDAQGNLDPEPKCFETHNCVDVRAGDFSKSGKKSLVFVNHQQSTAYGHIPVYVYLGSKDGYQPDNRLEFPGHSAGTMMPIDFNDDGFTDILVLHNAEDQPFIRPPADLYLGGPDGFSAERMVQFPAPLAWGGHCADLNKDGYLDVVSTGGKEMYIIYGGPDGYKEENTVVINLIEDHPNDTQVCAIWPTIADLNGDGWLDIVVSLSEVTYTKIYWGGPEGYSNERCTILPVDNPGTARVADLNKDGYPDLIFASLISYYRNSYHEGAITIFWGGPEGYSGYNCCVLPGYQTNNITIADLNGNGWLDMFVSSYFNKRERDIDSYIYWNDNGKFSLTNRKRIFAHSSSAAWAGDFNEDGYVDLCVTNHRAYGNHNTESAIWWNGPDGFKEENRTWLPTMGPHDMVPNDMGNVMTRGPEETYITPAVCVEDLKFVGWEAQLPIKTWVNCQIRTAATAEALETAEFVGIDGTAGSRIECDQAIPAELIKGKYVQIKLYIGAVNSGNSPRITEIYAG